MGAIKNESDFYYVCNTLFMEQRAALRKITSTDKQRFGTVAKGILLRRSVIVHLAASLPEWRSLIEELTGPAMYRRNYQLEPDGTRTGDIDNHNDGDKTDDEPDQESASEEEASTYKSRPLLVKFLKGLVSNKWERSLHGMAGATTSASGVLDLTLKAASNIKGVIDKITQAYEDDFKVPEVPSGPQDLQGNNT